MNKLLSIIIPTKNRQVYCIESIQSILEDIDEQCEIIIQDNSTDDSLSNMIKGLEVKNIIYNYIPEPLSFVENFEQALTLSSGKYFMILGDDDSTTKDTLYLVKWMDEKGIESIASSNVVEYVWPNEKIEIYHRGQMTLCNYLGDIELQDTESNLKELIKNGFIGYYAFNLPRTYHGIVKRSCMDTVKKLGGRYFGGLTPDIYSTIALACIVKKHITIDFPFSIAGACPASATVNARVGGHSGKLKDAPHFNYRGEYQWENSVPKFYSVETIWAESAIKAIKDMKREDLLTGFNKYKLYVYSIYLNKKYIFTMSFLETLKVRKAISENIVSHIYKLSKNSFKYFIQRYTRTRGKLTDNKVSIFKDVTSFKQCKEIITNKINFSIEDKFGKS